jgi:LAS superfamily LD-carboxypeptidase LdcB
MQFIGLLMMLAGIFFVNSSVKNRPPIRTIKALIDDPTDVTGTLDKLNGTWQTPENTYSASFGSGGATGTEFSPDPAGDAKQGKTGENGKLPDSALQRLSWNHSQRLAPAAAESFEKLNRQFKAQFGKNISVTDSYRTYAQQVILKARKGNLAAKPGTSNHGWGLAVDLGGGINTYGTTQYNWMLKNAPAYGWTNPEWARQGGSKNEPWHWEYGSGN